MNQLAHMIPAQLRPYAESTYRRIRRLSNRLDRLVDKRTIPEPRFVELLQVLGITSGATVMLHSSMDQITRRVPTLNPLRLIQMLQQSLGADGTLLMPTFPFTGRQLAYVETHETFDVRKTPSQVGLLTEVFRRMPGVRRSLHPTHPVAAWGKLSEEMLSEHHLGTTFGKSSPIFKLRNHDGLVVSLGAPFQDSFTILHVPEELHPKTREFAYEENARSMKVIDGKKTVRYEFRTLKADLRRNFGRVERALLRDGVLVRVNEKGLRCLSARAAKFIDKSMELITEGRYLF